MLNSKQIAKISELLFSGKQKNIIIVTHKNPDGDAVGSSLGLYNFLDKYHKVTVITPNEYPEFLKWLPGNDKVKIYEGNVKKCKQIIEKSDIVFCLDFNSLNRIGELGDAIDNHKAFKIIIDHHPQPEKFADITYSDIKACSTAQMIYNFIELLGKEEDLNKNIAECLYTGIMTDTGSFRYSSTNADTHLVAARLINAGADNADIHDKVYDNNSESRLKLIGFALSEKLKVLEEFHTAFISITKDELTRHNYQPGDTEGIVNYGLSIKGIKFSAFFSEKDDAIRISFRSKGDFSVNNFSRKHFNGGGHTNAAGGISELSMDETIVKFITLLPQYRDELNS
jgi:bifunctional oligoribonuclease and PAP phosphatase NrnA